jgi:hypothetical protein
MRTLVIGILVLASAAFLFVPVNAIWAQRRAAQPQPTPVSTSATAQPVDATAPAGNPLQEPVAHYVGITHAVLPVTDETQGSGLLILNRACFAEFPGTRACTRPELYQSIPPPPEWPSVVQVSLQFAYGGCLSSDGISDFCGSEAAPVICCGFK